MGNETLRRKRPITGGTGCRLLTTYAYIAVVVLAAALVFPLAGTRAAVLDRLAGRLLAVALIGPAQHRLLILGQEAAQGVLFRNRWLNELSRRLADPLPVFVGHAPRPPADPLALRIPERSRSRCGVGDRATCRLLAAAAWPAAAPVGDHPLELRCGRTTTSNGIRTIRTTIRVNRRRKSRCTSAPRISW